MAVAELSRDLIVQCALDLVRKGGVASLGLRPIARELDVTAPALYGYFDSLEDIVRALAEKQFEELDRRLSAFGRQGPEQKIRAQCRAYIEFAIDEPELFKLLFRYPPDLAASGIEYELPAATKVFEAAADGIKQGMDAGVFRQQDLLAAALCTWTATHGCATVLNLGFEFDEATRRQLIDDTLDMVIAGLR